MTSARCCASGGRLTRVFVTLGLMFFLLQSGHGTLPQAPWTGEIGIQLCERRQANLPGQVLGGRVGGRGDVLSVMISDGHIRLNNDTLEKIVQRRRYIVGSRKLHRMYESVGDWRILVYKREQKETRGMRCMKT